MRADTPRFVLFDIDGTLIDVKGAGFRAMRNALRELTGIPDGFTEIDVEGRTALDVIRSELDRVGLSMSKDLAGQIGSAYLKHLERELGICAGEILPGVVPLLDDLSGMENVYLALLTGNFRQGARLKLGAHGLNRYFEVGAFGDDDPDRKCLLPVAVQRLTERFGIPVLFEQCVVVGDTPRDIECSAVHGGHSIGVCTGKFNREALAATGANLVLPDLSDAGEIRRFLEIRNI